MIESSSGIGRLSVQALIDEMVEFGIPLDIASRMAPSMLPFFNDPRGIAASLAEAAPLLAHRLGVMQIH